MVGDSQRIYTLFNAPRERLLPFEFEGINVRFDNDSFGCEQLGANAWAIDELGSIETIFSVEDEVKNWAYFVSIGGLFIFTESSSFNFNLGSPPDGDYPETVYAPQEVLDYLFANGGTVSAYLMSATVDNGFRSVQFPSVEIATLGSVSYEPDGVLFGIGTEIDVLIYQRALGPCYFYGTVKWVVQS